MGVRLYKISNTNCIVLAIRFVFENLLLEVVEYTCRSNTVRGNDSSCTLQGETLMQMETCPNDSCAVDQRWLHRGCNS